MSRRLSLSGQQRKELEVLCTFKPADLKAIADGLRADVRPMLRARQLRRAIMAVLPDREADCTVLVHQLLGFHQLRRQSEMTADEIVELLDETVRRADEGRSWTEETLRSWDSIHDPLVDLLSLESIGLVAKTIDLAYEYTNIYQQARIITDLRPVFDTEGARVHGMVTCFTMRLTFDSREGPHDLGLGLDEADVRQLRAECDRALRKASTVQDLVIEPRIPITVFGATDDDAG